jgi:hypothetical protein
MAGSQFHPAPRLVGSLGLPISFLQRHAVQYVDLTERATNSCEVMLDMAQESALGIAEIGI